MNYQAWNVEFSGPSPHGRLNGRQLQQLLDCWPSFRVVDHHELDDPAEVGTQVGGQLRIGPGLPKFVPQRTLLWKVEITGLGKKVKFENGCLTFREQPIFWSHQQLNINALYHQIMGTFVITVHTNYVIFSEIEFSILPIQELKHPKQRCRRPSKTSSRAKPRRPSTWDRPPRSYCCRPSEIRKIFDNNVEEMKRISL